MCRKDRHRKEFGAFGEQTESQGGWIIENRGEGGVREFKMRQEKQRGAVPEGPHGPGE